jgi:hypothetical protein
MLLSVFKLQKCQLDGLIKLKIMGFLVHLIFFRLEGSL